MCNIFYMKMSLSEFNFSLPAVFVLTNHMLHTVCKPYGAYALEQHNLCVQKISKTSKHRSKSEEARLAVGDRIMSYKNKRSIQSSTHKLKAISMNVSYLVYIILVGTIEIVSN